MLCIWLKEIYAIFCEASPQKLTSDYICIHLVTLFTALKAARENAF